MLEQKPIIPNGVTYFCPKAGATLNSIRKKVPVCAQPSAIMGVTSADRNPAQQRGTGSSFLTTVMAAKTFFEVVTAEDSTFDLDAPESFSV